MRISGQYVLLVNFGQHVRDVPDPDNSIWYPVKFRHPALSGIRVKFAGYLPDSTVTYFITTIKRKSLLQLKNYENVYVVRGEVLY